MSLAGSFLYNHAANVHNFYFSRKEKTLFFFKSKFFFKANALQSFFFNYSCHFLLSNQVTVYICIKSHFYRRTLLTALRSSTPSLRNSSTIEGFKFNDKPLEEPPDVSSFDSSGIQNFDSVPGPKGIYALPFIGPLVHVKKFSKCNDEFRSQRNLVVFDIIFSHSNTVL